MARRIKMGNDEFILYLRKNKKGIDKTNDQLGKMIWIWLRDNANGKELTIEDCYWGDKGSFIDEYDLPKTSRQFEFDIAYLSYLYEYLDSI